MFPAINLPFCGGYSTFAVAGFEAVLQRQNQLCGGKICLLLLRLDITVTVDELKIKYPALAATAFVDAKKRGMRF